MDFCFAADKTLGKLAKWLRILGFDTLYGPDLPAGCLGGLEPERILLTRRSFRRRSPTGPSCVVIRSDQYGEQLVEVVQAVGVRADSIRPFSRCIRCNSPIIPIGKANLKGKIPDYIWETHDAFRTCPGCQRIYWAGSHVERCTERIRHLFNT